MIRLRVIDGRGQPEPRSFRTALARSRLKASLRVLQSDEAQAEHPLPGERNQHAEGPDPGGEAA